jgi:hypothetical protein
MIRRRYACPSCAKQFQYDHHPSVAADPLPRFCPHCGFDSMANGASYEPTLAAPAIGTGMVKRAEGVQAAVQEGANFRADMARETMGLDAEAAAMIRDTSTGPVDNAVSQAMARMPANTVGFNPANAAEYATTTGTGPYPNAGARAMQGVRAFHNQFTQGAGHAGATTSEIPALETQQPGYRRRA